MNNDWRLLKGQESYLHGVTLIYREYKPANPLNNHDHCEFCMEKFAIDSKYLNIGYSTTDNNIWICKDCYEEFKEQFKWKLIAFSE